MSLYKEQRKEIFDIRHKVAIEFLSGNLNSSKYELMDKSLRKTERFLFLKHKLKWINWVSLFAWLIIMGFVAWEATGIPEFTQIVGIIINGIAGLIPAVWIAEGVAIYRSMKVEINPTEILEMLNGKLGGSK